MLGRLRSSTRLVPDVRLTRENLVTKIVSGPICRKASLNDSSNPRRSDVIPTIEVMPITIPRIVSADLSLLPRSVSQDIATIS